VNEEQPQPQAGEPSEEELRAAFEEQMRRISVQDVLLQTVVTLVNLTGRRLTVEEEKDLEQARLGIDAVRALLPLCPEEQVAPVKDALSQLQMLFAREAQGGPPPPPGEPGEPGEQGEQPDQPGEDDAERAKARSKIWTPPGT
jgi:hypothetical protein